MRSLSFYKFSNIVYENSSVDINFSLSFVIELLICKHLYDEHLCYKHLTKVFNQTEP
jgi:hypothetical protein